MTKWCDNCEFYSAMDDWCRLCGEHVEPKGICLSWASKKNEGLKYDSEKLRYDLVPPVSLEKITGVLTYGAKKYAPENWRNVEDPERRYVAAAMRHIEAHRKGEIIDGESGHPHLAHAACCLMFLLDTEAP